MQFSRLLELTSTGLGRGRSGRERRRRRGLALALQGGGPYGAFTWGVLDRLLELEIPITSVSGASSGAMNAVLLVAGLQDGGPAQARERLATFWRRTSDLGRGIVAGSMLPRVLSPYQLNPLGINPLRGLVREAADFDRIAEAPVGLMIAATRVRDGRLRIFRNEDVTVDAVLASAALPMVHHAVEIEDEWYWDGGYAANPPVVPLALESDCREIVIVQVVPEDGDDAPPRTPRAINGRLAQMAFSRPLTQELDAIAAVKHGGLRAFESVAARKLRRLKLHRIRLQDAALPQHDATLAWDFLVRLRDAGRVAADAWLAAR